MTREELDEEVWKFKIAHRASTLFGLAMAYQCFAIFKSEVAELWNFIGVLIFLLLMLCSARLADCSTENIRKGVITFQSEKK